MRKRKHYWTEGLEYDCTCLLLIGDNDVASVQAMMAKLSLITYSVSHQFTAAILPHGFKNLIMMCDIKMRFKCQGPGELMKPSVGAADSFNSTAVVHSRRYTLRPCSHLVTIMTCHCAFEILQNQQQVFLSHSINTL